MEKANMMEHRKQSQPNPIPLPRPPATPCTSARMHVHCSIIAGWYVDRGRPRAARRPGTARAGGLFLHEAEGIAEYKAAAIFQRQGWMELIETS